MWMLLPSILCWTCASARRSRAMWMWNRSLECIVNRLKEGGGRRLLGGGENYAKLQLNENFLRMQDELAGKENRIAVERRKYNETVQKYNTDIELFPTNIAAGMFGFHRNDAYFKTEPGARTAPKVAF